LVSSRLSQPTSRAMAEHIIEHTAINTAWLAAHWEKKLKKADYDSTDISETCAKIQKEALALRFTGHLLLGVAKIHARKVQYLDSESGEVMTKMKMAWRDEPAGKKKTQALKVTEVDVNVSEFNAGEELPIAPAKGEKAKHVARDEDITLTEFATAAVDQTVSLDDEAFGAIDEDVLDDHSRLVDAFSQQEFVHEFKDPASRVRVDPPLVPPFDSKPGADPAKEEAPLEDDHPIELPVDEPMGTPKVEEPVAKQQLPETQVEEVPVPRDRSTVRTAAPPAKTGEPKPKKARTFRFTCLDAETNVPREAYMQTYKNAGRGINGLGNDLTMFVPLWDVTMPFASPFSKAGDVMRALYMRGFKKEEKPVKKAIKPPVAQHMEPMFDDPNDAMMSDVEDHNPMEDVAQVLITHAAEKEAAKEEPAAPPPRSEGTKRLLEEALGADDDDVGVGYSVRTQKMEKWIGDELKRAGTKPLKYSDLYEQKGSEDTLMVAACFFELLVLKTHTVIDVNQEGPGAEIFISRGDKWTAGGEAAPAPRVVKKARNA